MLLPARYAATGSLPLEVEGNSGVRRMKTTTIATNRMMKNTGSTFFWRFIQANLTGGGYNQKS